MTVRTDLHIHSCLSPCADEDMTPADLAGMSFINGQRLIALTDHNSARNCPAAAAAAAAYGLGFIPGMEVTTSEDIHAVCLFPDLCCALDFDGYIYRHIPDIPNRPEVFGNQVILDADGCVLGTEPRLLITGCDISILDLPGIVAGYGGVCYPAHIDREGNGLLGILGAWPPELDVRAAEVNLSFVKQQFSGGAGQNTGCGGAETGVGAGVGAEAGARAGVGAGTGAGAVAGTGAEAGVENNDRFGRFRGLIPEGARLIAASDAHRLSDLPPAGFPIELESADFSGLARWINSAR